MEKGAKGACFFWCAFHASLCSPASLFADAQTGAERGNKNLCATLNGQPSFTGGVCTNTTCDGDRVEGLGMRMN
jgi:hypothetical protein